MWLQKSALENMIAQGNGRSRPVQLGEQVQRMLGVLTEPLRMGRMWEWGRERGRMMGAALRKGEWIGSRQIQQEAQRRLCSVVPESHSHVNPRVYSWKTKNQTGSSNPFKTPLGEGSVARLVHAIQMTWP